MSSVLSMNVKRLGQILKEGAESQVGESGLRLEGASRTYWPLISKLLVSDFRYDRSYETAQDIFKKPSARFAAVDGSMDQSLLGGLAVFWAGAYAGNGNDNLHKGPKPSCNLRQPFCREGPWTCELCTNLHRFDS